MVFLLALSSAAFYGSADFLGGLATRRAAAIPVVLISQGAGLLLVLLLMPLLPAATPTSADIAWGTLAGVMGAVGVALLYHALAIGTMSVVAPTTAVCAVAIPVLTSVLLGEHLALLSAIGIVVGVAAIVLVSMQTPTTVTEAAPHRSGVGFALISGVAIGIFLYALAQAKPTAGMWPLVASRSTSTLLIGILALARRTSLRMSSRLLGVTLACGAVDMTANALYMIAARIGPLSPVVTLSSLYPATTVLLASAFLHERLNAAQKLGVALALGAVVLIVGAPA
ncbi:MAG TPA: DMT family transporter [Gemmatimonadaceae bacterium]|nr:DMT family transporter [Gemmatimonadaceae bacterium]